MKFKSKIRYITAVAVTVVVTSILVAAQKPDFKIGSNTSILIDLFRSVNMLYVDDVDPDTLLRNAAEGMLSGLDPYTEFVPEEDVADFEVLTTGKYGGMGALIRQKGDWVYISQPYRGFPADKAGLKIGDKIVEIDGVSAKGIGSSKVSSSLKGDPGTTLLLKVEKFDTGEQQDLTITRERIVISGIHYYGFVAEGIGYIQHSDFTEDCSSDMRKAIMELKKDGALKGLILDYRNNGGGILQEAVKILSLFVPKGTEVVTMKGRLPEMTVVFKTETEPIDTDTPIVVITNSGSASAAEIVSGALQDLDRAVLVGQRTFGKGLVQSPRPIGYNSLLRITTAKYFMPSGRCIQAIDYAHRNEDGNVGYVPDSLVREFATVGGRKVYDGGGIMPDIKTAPSYVSRFTMIAYAKGYTEDFAEMYVKKHPVPVDLKTFGLTDGDYADFVKFMEDKDVEYRSETADALKTMKDKAQRELYYDTIKDEIANIEKKLKDDKAGNLTLYREQISGLIEDNIILRHHYADGVIKYNLRGDENVEQAISLIGDSERYTNIITTQDTSRK